MHPLMLHRTCDLGPVRAITAAIAPTAGGCTAEFRIEGDIGRIIVPGPGTGERRDELWKTTCCEFFWQPIGGSTYYEFNLSPSGDWAAYRFDEYRQGMSDIPVEAITVACSLSRQGDLGVLVVKADIAADFASPAQVGLTAVIEHDDGELQYWSLAFPPGKPDFHSEACRQLIVER